MLYVTSFALALRCIGQELQSRNLEIFELGTGAGGFSLDCADPSPPYTGIIRLNYSVDRITVMDREAQSRRGQSRSKVFRFDSISETLRAIGAYIDIKNGYLQRLSSTGFSADPLELEYKTRQGDILSESLTMSFIHETAVKMYKRRTHLPHPVTILTRDRTRR
jgi:hypothetical protein